MKSIMNDLDVNKEFSHLLEERFRNKRNTVNLLSELLNMDKKSIYRRLSSEVLFTFSEICHISTTLGISVDNFMVGFHPVNYGLVNKVTFHDTEKDITEAITSAKMHISKIVCEPKSEMGNMTNSFPLFFFLCNKEILTLYNFYLNYRSGSRITYKEFKEHENTRLLVDQYYELGKEYIRIKHCTIVMGQTPAQQFMMDVNYLRSIRLLHSDDVKQIKNEVADFIDLLEDIAEKGYYDKYNTEYDIYIAQTSLDVNYYYFMCDLYSLSAFQMCMANNYSLDNENALKMKKWLDAMKNSSIQISRSSERHRIEFFDNQRKVLELF